MIVEVFDEKIANELIEKGDARRYDVSMERYLDQIDYELDEMVEEGKITEEESEILEETLSKKEVKTEDTVFIEAVKEAIEKELRVIRN